MRQQLLMAFRIIMEYLHKRVTGVQRNINKFVVIFSYCSNGTHISSIIFKNSKHHLEYKNKAINQIRI